EDIGELRLKKLLLLMGYCFSAIWCRFRYGARTLYYIPAPGKRSALFRDWMVMFLCRPFFQKMIFQWQAAGLAKWLETAVQIRTRSLTYRLMKSPDLGIVLAEYNRRDAEKLFTRKIVVVPNAIPDPCPDFARTILPRRLARSGARGKLLTGGSLTAEEKEKSGGDPQVFNVLFVAHCTREKGVFDTVDGVALVNQQLEKLNSPLRIHLHVAGVFIRDDERAEFEKRTGQPDLQSAVTFHGFVAGAEKFRLFAESDCLCFPTYYFAESFPVVLIEAMAFGAQVITSRWRSVPEVMPKNYPGLVEPKKPNQVAAALLLAMRENFNEGLRQHFLKNFTIEQHLKNLSAAMHSIE
ncbi:MAG: glycosyltransferase family 4 protein, partial [Verrucomicrobiota bacterium]